MHNPPQLDDERWELDPQFLQCRREMFLVLGLFLVSLIWTISVSYLLGYQTRSGIEADRLALVGGIPAWVFWGILLPWLVIDLVAVWFCFYYMQDEPVADSEEADCKIPAEGGVSSIHSKHLPNNGGPANQ